MLTLLLAAIVALVVPPLLWRRFVRWVRRRPDHHFGDGVPWAPTGVNRTRPSATAAYSFKIAKAARRRARDHDKLMRAAASLRATPSTDRPRRRKPAIDIVSGRRIS